MLRAKAAVFRTRQFAKVSEAGVGGKVTAVKVKQLVNTLGDFRFEVTHVAGERTQPMADCRVTHVVGQS